MAQFDNVEDDYDMELYNVVCTASLGCRLNLRKIAENGFNVVHQGGQITMKLRRPKVTARIWSKGKIMCTGATSEEQARKGVRRVARLIQRVGFEVELRQIRVAQVWARCTLPFAIRLAGFVSRHREASYEPELFPGVLYKIPKLKANLTIFWTGTIVIRAPSVVNAYEAAKFMYPQLAEFGREPTAAEEAVRVQKRLEAHWRLLCQ